jgi:hypothetical protein
MEPNISLPYSEDLATGSYPVPDKSILGSSPLKIEAWNPSETLVPI